MTGPAAEQGRGRAGVGSGRQPGARPLTSGQRAAVLHQGHALIEAGAGSGKTYTLVSKVLYQLGAAVVEGEGPLAGPERCELHQVAAITFTNAAAADLKKALRQAMREQARVTGDSAWRRRVHEVERARIGTIHSFCAELLREFGLRAGLEPRFRVLDEGGATLLRKEAVREELLAALRAQNPAATRLAGELGLREARRLMDEAIQKGEAAERARLRWCPGGEPDLEDLRSVLSAAPGAPPWSEVDDRGAGLAADLLALAERARTRMERALEAETALDFDALVYRARDLLRERDDVRAQLGRRLRWLFVDEFQDTDPAQKELAYLICGLPAERPEAPRLCVVGDPKQSIYRFRRADVSLWNLVAADLRTLGVPPIRLETSFRSRAPILGYVNAAFQTIMAAPDEVAYAPLAPHRDVAGDDDLVEVLRVEGEGADERRRAEAEAIAERIDELFGEPVLRGEDGKPRSPTARDFAVLLRSWTGVDQYEAALRRRGVPCFVGGSAGFFQRREVRDLRLLLLAISDPNDDVALAGVLRSPFVALTDESLLRLRIETAGRLWRAVEAEPALPGGDGERLADARGWLLELRELQGRAPTAALLARALERSGYLPGLLLSPDGAVAAANVRKLVGMAEAHPEWSTRELLEYLDERADSSREPEAALHTAGEDVVVITTVHQAKGLEWPIVFLADLERDIVASSRRPPLLLDAETGIGLDWKGEAADGELRRTSMYDYLRGREELLSIAEEKRVWYVAATRARDRLVLCVGAEGGAGDAPPRRVRDWLLAPFDEQLRYAYGDRAWAARDARPRVDFPAPQVPPEPPTLPRIQGAPDDAALAARLAPVPAGVPRRVHSASELMLRANDPREHARVYGLGLPPRFGPAPAAADGSDVYAEAAREAEGEEETVPPGGQLELLPPRVLARLTGDVLHGVLERLELLDELDRLLAVELGGRLGAGAPADLRHRLQAELREMIERTATHPRIRPLLGSGAAERELSFTWLLPVDGRTAILRGSIDLAAPVEDEVAVVDYKSNRLREGQESTLARRYAIQRDVYVAALSALSGFAPRELLFFFAATGAAVPPEVGAPLPDSEVTRAAARVARAVRELRLASLAGS